jgi:flagellar motor switch protein FliN/FliY
MATAQSPPTSAGAALPGAATKPRAAAGETIQALVPSPQSPQSEQAPVFSGPIPQLPVELGVTIPVRDFRVRQLLALTPGQVIETQWSHGDDLPLAAGDVQLAWTEFEVVETRLAVRVTRLA